MNPNTAALWQIILAGINAALLFATLVVLICYTVYTYRLQTIARNQTDELIHQRKLSNLPAFIASPLDPRQSNRISLLKVGKGVAMNVVCEDIHVATNEHPDARIILPPVPAIKPGQEFHPGVDFAGLGDRAEHNRAMNAPPIENYLNHDDYVLTVNFCDVEGNRYTQRLQMNHGKCAPERVLQNDGG
jgi:hypothetical protein